MRERGESAPVDQSPRLATSKVAIPPTGTSIERGRLQQALTEGAKRKLALIKAPTGYGKTTLAAMWAQRLRDEGALVAWLTLDADDNEPSLFARYIASAFEVSSPELAQEAIEFAKTSSLAPARNLVSLIANAACEVDDEIYLFLDEYQTVTDVGCHDLVSQLLRYTLSNFHLVLISRAEPRLSVSRYKLEEQFAEVGTADLLFDAEETARFFGPELLQKLGRRGVWKLLKATEGWPAAMQLARITLRRAADPLTQIQNLSGSSRNISEYLEDTIAALDPALVDFLIKTSVLQHMNAPLCDAVTGGSDASASLANLRREQVLLETFDGAPDWFRHHRLMRDHLLARLRSMHKELMPLLYRRAYEWSAANGLHKDAAHYAMQAGEHRDAVAAVKACGMDLIARGDLATLLSWARQLPDELVREQYDVALALAWGMALVTRFKEARAYLDQAERALPTGSFDDQLKVRAARAVLRMLEDDSASGGEIASQCLKQGRFDDFTTDALRNVVRYHRLRIGAPSLDDEPHQADVAEGPSALPAAFHCCLRGVAAMKRLQLNEAAEHFARGNAIAQQRFGLNSVVAAMVDGLIAQRLYESGECAQAELIIIDHLELIETTSFHESFLQAFRTLSRAAASRGDVGMALSLLNRGERLAWERGWKRVVATLIGERLHLSLQAGDLVGASALTNSLDQLLASAAGVESDIAITAAHAHGRLALASDQPAAAIVPLQFARDRLLTFGDELGALYVGIDLASAHARIGSLAAASGLLTSIMEKAERYGCRAGLVSIDPEMRDLIYRDRVRSETNAAVHPAPPEQADRPVLTVREQSIVAFIASGRSNKEIARELGVGPETIKTQLKRIFQKLSAETRTQAVVRAQYLGLLGAHAQSSQMRH